MNRSPFISICIPAYKRPQYLRRLLKSIAIQSYKNFELILTDDSPDNSVKVVWEEFNQFNNFSYYKNESALGTPLNWNEAISKATGKWVKLMHDDDWFADENALMEFANKATDNPNSFIFSAHIDVYEHASKEKIVLPEKFRIQKAIKEPAVLWAKNFIGPPSVTLYKNDARFLYDINMKWLVDIDMYRRRLESDRLVYIPKPLIKIGVSDSQVTAYTKSVGAVEIPEHFLFLQKVGTDKLKNMLVYDYNWRFIRNFNIKETHQLREFGYNGEIPEIIDAIIASQKKIPNALLKNGIMSKLLMALNYVRHKNQQK